MYIIYVLESPSGKKYVGKTSKTLNERFKGHQKSKQDTQLTRALKCYDPKDWKLLVLERCQSNEDANNLECMYIDQLKTYDNKFGYNMTKGGDGLDSKTASRLRKEYFKSAAGQEWKKELSKRWTEDNPGDWSGKTHSEETKAKISKSNLGKTRTKEQKQERSILTKKLWADGVYDNRPLPTPEQIKKAADARRGYKQSDYQKQTVSKLLAKTWEVISPEGEIMIIENLNLFCREKGLDQSNLSRGSYKKWKARRM